MEQKIRRLLLRQDEAPHPTIETIRQVCARMEAVQSRFEQETDPDLIEGCIYELEALRAQYRFLLRTAKEEGIASREKRMLWDG